MNEKDYKDLIERYSRDETDESLQNILHHPNNYKAEAVEAARFVLAGREKGTIKQPLPSVKGKLKLYLIAVSCLFVLAMAYYAFFDPVGEFRRDINKISMGMSTTALINAIGEPEDKWQNGGSFVYRNHDATRMLIVFIADDSVCGWVVEKKGSSDSKGAYWSMITGKGHSDNGANIVPP